MANRRLENQLQNQYKKCKQAGLLMAKINILQTRMEYYIKIRLLLLEIHGIIWAQMEVSRKDISRLRMVVYIMVI